MAKLSEKYEAVVVFSLKNGEDAVKALVAKFSDLIKEHGTLVDVDEWGARKLCYPRINSRNRRLLCSLSASTASLIFLWNSSVSSTSLTAFSVRS